MAAGGGTPAPDLGSAAVEQEAVEALDVGLGQGHPGRHAVPAAMLQQALLPGRDHGGTEIEAADRAGGALGDPVGDPEHHGRPVVPLHEPAGDDADDARVPARAGGQQDRQPGRELRLDRAPAPPRSTPRSIACRSALSAWSWSASCAASSAASVVSRRAPRSERPMRPPALMRGPRTKPNWRASVTPASPAAGPGPRARRGRRRARP